MFSSVFLFYLVYLFSSLFSQVTCRLHFSIPILNKGLGWRGSWPGFSLVVQSWVLVASSLSAELAVVFHPCTGLVSRRGSPWALREEQASWCAPSLGGEGGVFPAAWRPLLSSFSWRLWSYCWLSCAPGPQRLFRDLPGRSLTPELPCVRRVLTLGWGWPELCAGSAGSACSPLSCGMWSGPLLALSRRTPWCLQHRQGGEEGSTYSSPARPSFGLVME